MRVYEDYLCVPCKANRWKLCVPKVSPALVLFDKTLGLSVSNQITTALNDEELALEESKNSFHQKMVKQFKRCKRFFVSYFTKMYDAEVDLELDKSLNEFFTRLDMEGTPQKHPELEEATTCFATTARLLHCSENVSIWLKYRMTQLLELRRLLKSLPWVSEVGWDKEAQEHSLVRFLVFHLSIFMKNLNHVLVKVNKVAIKLKDCADHSCRQSLMFKVRFLKLVSRLDSRAELPSSNSSKEDSSTLQALQQSCEDVKNVQGELDIISSEDDSFLITSRKIKLLKLLQQQNALLADFWCNVLSTCGTSSKVSEFTDILTIRDKAESLNRRFTCTLRAVLVKVQQMQLSLASKLSHLSHFVCRVMKATDIQRAVSSTVPILDPLDDTIELSDACVEAGLEDLRQLQQFLTELCQTEIVSKFRVRLACALSMSEEEEGMVSCVFLSYGKLPSKRLKSRSFRNVPLLQVLKLTLETIYDRTKHKTALHDYRRALLKYLECCEDQKAHVQQYKRLGPGAASSVVGEEQNIEQALKVCMTLRKNMLTLRESIERNLIKDGYSNVSRLFSTVFGMIVPDFMEGITNLTTARLQETVQVGQPSPPGICSVDDEAGTQVSGNTIDLDPVVCSCSSAVVQRLREKDRLLRHQGNFDETEADESMKEGSLEDSVPWLSSSIVLLDRSGSLQKQRQKQRHASMLRRTSLMSIQAHENVAPNRLIRQSPTMKAVNTSENSTLYHQKQKRTMFDRLKGTRLRPSLTAKRLPPNGTKLVKPKLKAPKRQKQAKQSHLMRNAGSFLVSSKASFTLFDKVVARKTSRSSKVASQKHDDDSKLPLPAKLGNAETRSFQIDSVDMNQLQQEFDEYRTKTP